MSPLYSCCTYHVNSPLLDRELVESVPNLHDANGPGRPIHEAAALAQKLESDKKKVLLALNQCSGDGPMGPGSATRFNPESDARVLLAGTDVSTLTAPVTESERAALLRQLRAVELAGPAARDKVGEVQRRIVVEQSERLRQTAQGIIGDVVAAAENLLAYLEVEQQFFALLDKRGFHGGMRPAFLHFWPQESCWVGGNNFQPPLRTYIKTRCESAGIPEPAERK